MFIKSSSMVNSSTNASTPIHNNFSMSKVVWATPMSQNETMILLLVDSVISDSNPLKLHNIVSRSPQVMMTSVEVIQNVVKTRRRMVEPLSCII